MYFGADRTFRPVGPYAFLASAMNHSIEMRAACASRAPSLCVCDSFHAAVGASAPSRCSGRTSGGAHQTNGRTTDHFRLAFRRRATSVPVPSVIGAFVFFCGHSGRVGRSASSRRFEAGRRIAPGPTAGRHRSPRRQTLPRRGFPGPDVVARFRQAACSFRRLREAQRSATPLILRVAARDRRACSPSGRG